ncbi:hypothetical protein [Dysgonomonas massiliensis]|uniref:hypothetical protein n=1 Tax=Dysgonomonas massiliensis TaxID=2040292 RepID=UPI00161FAD24|nr:hypothetical protein [Dysgonomonas massiliensis]
MKKLEVLQDGNADDLDLLSDEAMNRLKGGTSCKKGYSADFCECGYSGPAMPDEHM